MHVTFKAVGKWPSGTVVSIQNAKNEFLSKVPGGNKVVCTGEVCEVERGSEWILMKQDAHTYQISHILSGLCLDVFEESKKNGAPVLLWTTTGHKNQLWEFSEAKGELYYVRAAHSHRALDMIDGKADKVGQWDLWGGPNQLWKIRVLAADTV